jgi:hypothetical protein
MTALFRLCTALLWLLLAAGFAAAAPSPGIRTDRLVLAPQSSAPGCISGSACVYLLAADSQLYGVDGSGVLLKIHSAKAVRTSSNCSALASPANGDVCYDTTASTFRFYSGGWTTPTSNDALVVHKAGTETITGAKTFSAATVLGGGATLGADLAGGGFKGTGFGQGTSSGQLLTAGRQVLTSAPLTGGGALTGDLTLGLSVSAPLAVGGGALLIDAAGLVYDRPSGAGVGALGAGTVYLNAPGSAAGASERALAIGTRAGTLRALYCSLGTAPGGADTVVATVRVAASDSVLTCTITGAATSCNDTTHTASVSAGQSLSVKAVSSAGTAADLICAFEQTN